MSSNHRGQVITFYSYKGGTGRTMALANVACILAERQAKEGGKGVLMIDWDLEAPGLHRYFRNRISGQRLTHNLLEDPLDSQPGLIDLFYELDQKLDYYSSYKDERNSRPEGPMLSSERVAQMAIKNADLQSYIIPTTLKGLSLLKAGRFNSEDSNEYSDRVNKFNWEALYKKSQHLIRVFAETLADQYAFVLIDSRTGITDISGICTMQLPEKLVVVFTPNTQSLKGGLDLIRRATDYRKESADLRPLLAFPLVSRVEANEPDLRHEWRFGNTQQDDSGYQPLFEKLLKVIYNKKEVKLDKYFDELQIQHIPRYAYGEEIAVLVEKISDKFSLRRSYQTFASKLAESRAPWEGEIKDVDSLEGEATRFQASASLLLEILRSRVTKRRIKKVLFTFIILIGIFGTVFSYYQFQRSQKDRAALEEERQKLSNLGKPQKLSGRIDQIKFLPTSNGGQYIFIRLLINNYGSPTKVDKYSLYITHAYLRDFELKDKPVELTENFTLPQEGSAASINIRPQDSILSITNHVIDKDKTVEGWLGFDLSTFMLRDDLLRRPGTRYIVSFNDDENKTYVTTYEMF